MPLSFLKLKKFAQFGTIKMRNNKISCISA